MMRRALCAVVLAVLAACATVPDVADVKGTGSVVTFNQQVRVADLVLTPLRVAEDSRCPINARCAWAGRIVVETRVAGAGWQEVLLMTLDEPARTRGYVLSLVSAEPGRMAGSEPAPPAHLFSFAGTAPAQGLD